MSTLPINLVFASDNNFLKYTATTLLSVLQTMKTNRALSVYILTDRPLGSARLEKVERLKKVRDFNLFNLIVDASQFQNIRTTPGISLATFYRLRMHEVLPSHTTRALYLDSDVIVRTCISALYDTDMQGALFAGVQDSLSYAYAEKFGFDRRAPHINAGVTVVDVAALRKADFNHRVDTYLAQHRYLITLGDQQIINCAFNKEIRYVPATWNVHGSMFDKAWRTKNIGINNSFTLAEIEAAVNDPGIVHYTFKRKPWVSIEHPKAWEWWNVAVKTPFFSNSDVPAEAVAAPKEKPKSVRKPSSPAKKAYGYLKSIVLLRQTRLKIDRLEKEVKPTKQNTITPHQLLVDQSGRLLSEIGNMYEHEEFDASSFVQTLPELSRFLTNGEQKDIDGGFHENLKTILRTPNIRRTLNLSEADFVLILVQRLRQDLFWTVLNAARYYQKKPIFAETTFFGAFATYFNTKAPPMMRRSFGYILDDMGYYFDARSPSRLEQYLNSEKSVLSTDQIQRSKRLIDMIIREGITKYNFSSSQPQKVDFPRNSVLVVDQKRGDASIEFAAADAETFSYMIQCAINENPHSTIFLKPHPDNMGEVDVHMDKRVKILPAGCRLTDALDHCERVYVVSSQAGFEAILRGKHTEVFGLPFYAGWGLTNDRQRLPRRKRRITIEELFHAACIKHSVYVNPQTGHLIEIEDAFNMIRRLTEDASRQQAA
ncbi:glycosyltransferase [Rhizobium mongolense]|uniref:glycosyltransferase n=1 Tax=Rhizobium mongolense TaxID=57676 RepID=UPI0034A41CF0